MICAALLLSSYWGHAARRYPPDDQHQGRAPNATWDDHVPGLPHRDDFDREVRKRFDLPHTREPDWSPLSNLHVIARHRWAPENP